MAPTSGYWVGASTPEDIESRPRRFGKSLFLDTLKELVEMVPEGEALQQIKERGYADKYVAPGVMVYLLGVEFSKDSRNIVGFEVEECSD